MATTLDNVETLNAMATVLTAFTSCTGVSTATFAASMASQVSADTSLTAGEKAIITALTSGLASVTPSSSFNISISNASLGGAVDSRTIFGAMVSILTAFSSATGTSTTNFAAALGRQQTADTGLSNVETGLVTLLTSAIGSATPSLNAHNQV